MGDRQRPGENQPNTRRENAQLRPGSVRKSLSCCPRESLRLMHEPDPYQSGSFGAAGSRRRAHIQARPSRAGGGRRERARPALAAASGPLLQRVGRRGRARRGPEAGPGPASGRRKRRGAARAAAAARGAKSKEAAAATGQRRPCAEGGRREREEEEEGAPRRRRRRLLPGGGLGLPDCPARLSSSAAGRLVLVPPPPPPRSRGTLRESLFGADLAGARRGVAAAVGAPGRLHGADGASWPELAGRRPGRPRDWLGSGPRSARGRLPLPPAHSSSELHRRPAPRTPWLDRCGRGRRQNLGPWPRTSLPDCAQRASSRRSQLSERDFLGPPSRSRGCHRPSSVPPLAPRPSPPLLSAPAPGPPRGGAVPGRDIGSCCSPHRGSGPRSPGCLPGGRVRLKLQRSAPSP